MDVEKFEKVEITHVGELTGHVGTDLGPGA
jgi:hypothetical protein